MKKKMQNKNPHISDPHNHGSSLSNVILGGQDGLVNVLGLILGVAIATLNRDVVIVAGMAAAFAESIAMAGVAYTSNMAQSSRYYAERERELRHVKQHDEEERQDLVKTLSGLGFNVQEAHALCEIISKNMAA